MFRYTFLVHNFPNAAQPALSRKAEAASSRTMARRAARTDTGQILELVAHYAAQGLMLPRSFDQVAARIDNYVVVTDNAGRVIACAALEEYSPSLAEVSSVAVAPSHQGKGLGSQVVLGVERLARARDIEELFALSLTDNFFLSLSYKLTTVSRYPEKLARYDTLTKSGVDIVPRRCFQKVLGNAWSAPQLLEETPALDRQKRLA
jgi:amino-acid N-acetyltransferase